MVSYLIKLCKEVGGSMKWNWNRKKGRKGHGVGFVFNPKCSGKLWKNLSWRVIQLILSHFDFFYKERANLKDKANEDMCEEVLVIAEGEMVISRIRMPVAGWRELK